MSNKNKIIIIIIVAALVGLPYWRINSNSKVFADGVVNQLKKLGTWSFQSVDTELNGQITINDLRFVPKGFKQGMMVDSIEVHSDIRKLIFSSPVNLLQQLPKSMTLSLNQVQIDNNADDFITKTESQNYWPMVVGYLGAYGCGTAPGPGFSDTQWDGIFDSQPEFNIEISYSQVDDYHLDFNFNIDSPSNWYIAWSGTLTRTSDVPEITFEDTILETLYYYHVDKGFNQKRNAYCATENNDSFAAYRLKSAEEIQKYLRVYAGKELPQFLSNQYQRSLAENIEVNAIFKFREPLYLEEFANMAQKEFFSSIELEAAIGENPYQAIELSDIDFLELDMETLRAEMEAKQKEAARLEAEANKPKELLKTITHTMGGTKNEYVIDDWNTAIGQNIKIRTKRGRPIFGRLLSIDDTHLTIASRYMRGDVTMTVAKSNVVSMTTNK